MSNGHGRFEVSRGFSFEVSLEGDVAGFSEVSGLENRIEVEPISEGGENRFSHQLPVGTTRGNLILKRGLLAQNGALIAWFTDIMEGGFSKPTSPKSLAISLLGQNGEAVMKWQIENAYPVKWSVDAMDVSSGFVAVESIELAYQTLSRQVFGENLPG